ncbi:MAG TPA: DUF2264 domain-containing protein [Humibacter sp.]|nr:DUF2264 domain-containing protein [Humibacter sp.]
MTPLTLPAEDRARSPHTGLTREHWATVADQLLLALRPYFSSTRARVLPPGRTSSSGSDSDGLEGFARSFMLVAFRMVGENGDDPHGLLDWYRDGVIAGTDPSNPERWPRPGTVPQAKVEAASVALGLQLTRPWLWDTLDERARANVIDWFAEVINGWYPPNNWLWFRVAVETFLASVGGPFDKADIAADLALFESYYREHGWYADGPGRSFDYYCGWAMQFYPLLWAGWDAAKPFGSESLAPVWRERLADYLDDYVTLIGGDGMPVMQGRSLIYRFAAAAPLWMGAASGAARLEPGLIRRAASGILRAYLDHGVPDDRGLLTLGLFGEWPGLAQTYSGSASPYWAAKGMFGLALPASHPVWTAVEQPLPIELADVSRVIAAPGWLVSGTRADGIVRVVNHGTDHAGPGDATTDSPIYARLGYSSATIPPLTGGTIDSPVDSSVSVLDASGRASHRTGFELVAAADDGATAFGASIQHAHWVDVVGSTTRDHGSGRQGIVTSGPRLAVASLVRGAWELRFVRVLDDGGAERDRSPVPLRFSGWPLAAAGAEAIGSAAGSGTCEGEVVVTAGRLTSRLIALGGLTDVRARIHTDSDVSPLGSASAVPWLDAALTPGALAAVAVCLSGDGAVAPAPSVELSGHEVVVTWGDGALWRGAPLPA